MWGLLKADVVKKEVGFGWGRDALSRQGGSRHVPTLQYRDDRKQTAGRQRNGLETMRARLTHRIAGHVDQDA